MDETHLFPFHSHHSVWSQIFSFYGSMSLQPESPTPISFLAGTHVFPFHWHLCSLMHIFGLQRSWHPPILGLWTVLLGKVQSPTLWIAWQVAPVGQPLSFEPGVQIRAQYLSPAVVLRAHWGLTVVPAGTSVGQAVLNMPLHLGEQKSPETPWTFTSCSSVMQPFAGSP